MLQNMQLWYLVQLQHYQSLSQAAEELHVSQPAISNAIKRLEEQLGVTLLHRTNKGITLTKEGELAAEKAKQILALMEEMETMFQSKNAEENQFLLDDVIIYTNPILAPPLLSALSKEYSNSTAKHALQIFNLTPEAVTKSMLIGNSINTVILAILPEDFITPNNIATTVLDKSKAYIQCAQEFPYFPPEQNTVSAKELMNVPLIVNKSGFLFQNRLLDMLRQYGEPNIKIVAPDSKSITPITKTGIVANFTFKFSVGKNDKELRHIAIKNSPTFHLALVYNKSINPLLITKLESIISTFL